MNKLRRVRAVIATMTMMMMTMMMGTKRKKKRVKKAKMLKLRVDLQEAEETWMEEEDPEDFKQQILTLLIF